MRHAKILLTIILVAFGAAALAKTVAPVVTLILPRTNDVAGFAVMKDSLQYGKGDGITDIYNGGYELYTKNGVLDAARQMYQRGKSSDYVEVTVHTMKSEKSAVDFLKYWQKALKGTKIAKSGKTSGFTTDKPNKSAYFVTGKYFTTVIAFYNSPDAKKHIAAFQKSIVKRTSAAGGK